MFRRGKKLQYIDEDITWDKLVRNRSTKLFKAITTNEGHILHTLLPPTKSNKYELRERSHCFHLPELHSPHDTRNFIIRMLYS